MQLNIFLMADLEGASVFQREIFDEQMTSAGWRKLDNLCATYEASFVPGTDRRYAMAITRATVAKAASLSGIDSYDASCFFADASAETFRAVTRTRERFAADAR